MTRLRLLADAVSLTLVIGWILLCDSLRNPLPPPVSGQPKD